MSITFQDSWPEDEAYSQLVTEKERRENDWSEEEIASCRLKDNAHMQRVFMREDDGEELYTRFIARLEKGLED